MHALVKVSNCEARLRHGSLLQLDEPQQLHRADPRGPLRVQAYGKVCFRGAVVLKEYQRNMTVLFCYTYPKQSTSPEGISTPMLHTQGCGPGTLSLQLANGWSGLKAARLERGRGRPAACRGHITFRSGHHLSMSVLEGFLSLACEIQCQNMVKPDVLRVLEEHNLLLES